MATASKKSSAKSKDISIKFAVMGQEPSKKSVKKGFTLGEAKSRWNLQGLTVTVNGNTQDDSYVFSANDALTAVPQVKGGR